MLFVEGSVGRIWRVIPLVVIPTLFWSLIESLTILPAHLAHMKTKESKFIFLKKISLKWESFQLRVESSLSYFIKEKYTPLLKKSSLHEEVSPSVPFVLAINWSFLLLYPSLLLSYISHASPNVPFNIKKAGLNPV